MTNLVNIEFRRLYEENTDPQRRCYNGCHAKSEWRWTEWEVLELGWSPEKAESRLNFWRELTAEAVKARGQSGQSEYRIVNQGESS